MVVVVQELRVEQGVSPERVWAQVRRVVELVVRPAPQIRPVSHWEHHVGVGVARGRHRHPLVGHPGLVNGGAINFRKLIQIMSL